MSHFMASWAPSCSSRISVAYLFGSRCSQPWESEYPHAAAHKCIISALPVYISGSASSSWWTQIGDNFCQKFFFFNHRVIFNWFSLIMDQIIIRDAKLWLLDHVCQSGSEDSFELCLCLGNKPGSWINSNISSLLLWLDETILITER